jgi:hypothetical protein
MIHEHTFEEVQRKTLNIFGHGPIEETVIEWCTTCGALKIEDRRDGNRVSGEIRVPLAQPKT